MASSKKIRRITDFFGGTAITSNNTEDGGHDIDSTRETEAARANVDRDENGGHSDENESSNAEASEEFQEDNATDCKSTKDSSKQKYVHRFRKEWMNKYDWLEFDESTGVMSCKVCRLSNYKNTMTMNCRNYRLTTLSRHVNLPDHLNALKNQVMRKDFDKATTKAVCSKSDSIVSAMRCVYWLSKEGIATMKYTSLLELLKLEGCENIEALGVGKNASYQSRITADEFQDAIMNVIQEDIDAKIQESVFTSILIDESTDINVTKKLVINGQIVTEELDTEGLFLGNIPLESKSATADVIFTKLKEFLKGRGLSVSKVTAFGSDGASTMTGRRNGVATLIRNESPHSVNIHCLAHRLSLVTSKSADDVEYIKQFQKTLTELFYYFKKSSSRVTELKNIQAVLEEPQLKMKEVHEVRWFSIYSALHAVYSCWRSLVKYFKDIKKRSPKEEELLCCLTEHVFVTTLHIMMDIIPSFTQLSLIFQKADLDIACVQPAVNGCMDTVKHVLAGKTYFQLLLKDKLNLSTTEKQKSVTYWGVQLKNFDLKKAEVVREKLCQSLQSRLSKRFPEESTSVATAFSVMGMRSISFLSKEEREQYGKKEIDILSSHYGQDLTSPNGSISSAVVDKDATVREWELVKTVVIDQMYPRDNFKTLWKIIHCYHSDVFPNLLTLARIALIMPLHTAACERAFSCQNDLLSPSRNRLSPETLNKLMLIKLQGPPIDKFDFKKAVAKWKSKKERRLFKQ